MGPAVPDITADDIGFLCDNPNCELAGGALGLTAAEIQARVLAQRAQAPAKPDTTDPKGAGDEEDEDDAEDDAEDEDEADAGDDAADPTAIDPLGEGAPCPLCCAAVPPRNGKLLAVPHRGTYARVLAATTGVFGLRFWMLVESDSKTGTNRLLDAQRHAVGESTKSKATTSFVIGRKAITAVVLKELPFDGHLLRYGNRDSTVYEYLPPDPTKPAKKGAKRRPKKGWAEGEAKYGLDHAPPGPAARANPIYIRELQEDLIWLGYLSTTRGSPTPGKFDVFTLGAVLAFKQDLAEVYGVSIGAERKSVPPGSVRAGEFSTPIWSQAAFVSPARIMRDWGRALIDGNEKTPKGKKRKGRGIKPVVGKLATGIKNHLARAKKTKDFRAHLSTLESRRAGLDALMASWPHLAALERVTEPYKPFAPKQASRTVDELPAIPAGKQPKHPDAGALKGDPIWSSGEYNARAANRHAYLGELSGALAAIEDALDDVADARGRIEDLTPPADVADDWSTAKTATLATLARISRLLPLVRFWILDSPRQQEAWLAHIIDMGVVDQPTAVYLKALREGGKIGPGRRPAYQLAPLTSKDDFASADAGATYLRSECTGRPGNKPGRSADTMPEIVALQFFGNESGLKFTHTVAPFNTRAEDKSTRVVLMGADTNAHRRGSFDPVFHVGGDWYTSRGWGVGQATDVDIKLDGVQLRRGLPILPAGAETVAHPKAYIDHKASVTDALERKVLPKFDRTDRRDCTFGDVPNGNFYDCHSCLKRFFDLGLTGQGEHGKGGVFVPVGKNSIGSLKGATRFFLDLERYTPYARGADGVENPDLVNDYFKLFGVDAPVADPSVVAVLRRTGGKATLKGVVEAVAKELTIDKDALLTSVKAHVAAREQLPCSWLLVRIFYAGSGEQAFGSLMDLLGVVGDLKTSNETLKKHILEASALRGGT